MKTNLIVLVVIAAALLSPQAQCQETFSLQQCLDYALQNNSTLRKSKLDVQKAGMARAEILGALLPQISGQAQMTNNIDKTTFVMPNFINNFLPSNMQDPDASKYMTIEMGMNWTANVGLSLSQQVLNFALFNAVDIAKAVEQMAVMGEELSEEDVISQTATLYFGIQVLEYAVEQFDLSLELMGKLLGTMKTNLDNGLVRSIDHDRLKVALTNMQTQKGSLYTAKEIQKTLLKMQMGMDVNLPIKIQAMDPDVMEPKIYALQNKSIEIEYHPVFNLMKKQVELTELKYKAAVYEHLPMVSLGATYATNFMSDEFFKGDTFYKYPMSNVGLTLRMPIFSGMSRRSKINQARVEIKKIEEDKAALSQSLQMNYSNSLLTFEQNREAFKAQAENVQLAKEVYVITENNYNLGISSMTDVINSSSDFITAQVNYVESLGKCLKAYVDLCKSNGTIKEITNNLF